MNTWNQTRNLAAVLPMAATLSAPAAEDIQPSIGEPLCDVECSLENVFLNPPEAARVYTWWHWVNGHITKAGITRDLENMSKAGIGGAIIFHNGNFDISKREATEKTQEFMRRTGTDAASNSRFIEEVGPVPDYLGKEHLALLRHAADEARRLGLTLGMHSSSGWSGSGGPWIKPQHAYKNINLTEHQVKGGEVFQWTKPKYDPESGQGFVGVVAFRTPATETAGAKPQLIGNADEKLAKSFRLWALWNTHNGGPIPHGPAIPGDATVDSSSVTNLTPLVGNDGQLTWTAPEGDWTVLIATYEPGNNSLVFAMPSGNGLVCDRLDAAALECHWENGIMPVLNALGDHIGRVASIKKDTGA